MVAVVVPVRAGATDGPAASIASITLEGAVQPDQVVAADGQLWLVTSGRGLGDPGAACDIARADPVRLVTVSFALPACGINATAGDGAVFLETAFADVAAGTYDIRIERFDTTAHSAVVFAAVSATVFLGSAIAHTQLAFASGSLWLYVDTPGPDGHPEVAQLSAHNGAPVRTFDDVPPIGGTEPIISGAGPYVWLAGGAGVGGPLLRIDVTTGATRRFLLARRDISLFGLLAGTRRVFFLYLSAAPSPRGRASAHVGRIALDGTGLSNSPAEPIGDQLVVDGATLLSAGTGTTCGNGVRVWRVDPVTLRSTRIARVPLSAGNPCLTSIDRPATAVVGRSLFYLASSSTESVLSRITPSMASRTRHVQIVRSASHGGSIVPDDLVEEVFEPFRRIEVRTGHDGGFGLGLAVVRSIATAHGPPSRPAPAPTVGLR